MRDIRCIIAGLLGFYVNLWTGIALLVMAAIFAAGRAGGPSSSTSGDDGSSMVRDARVEARPVCEPARVPG